MTMVTFHSNYIEAKKKTQNFKKAEIRAEELSNIKELLKYYKNRLVLTEE